MAGSRFERYDHELEDSDQTISAYTRLRRSTTNTPPRSQHASPLMASGCSSRIRPRKATARMSSFFPDTTDDEAVEPNDTTPSKPLSSSATARAFSTSLNHSRVQNARSSDAQRLYMGDIQFPVTRSVLWDRRPLGASVFLMAQKTLPRFQITNTIMKQLHAQLQQHNVTQTMIIVGHLHADPAEMTATLNNTVTFSTFQCDPSLNRQSLCHTWCLPVCSAATEDATTVIQNTRSRNCMDAWQNPSIEALYSKFHPFLLTRPTDHPAQLCLEFRCTVPKAAFELTPIRNLPVLMTTLATSLCHGGDPRPRAGFVTLDRARKAVPLLQEDPLVYQRPMVGVWVTVCADQEDAMDVMTKSLHLYLACLSYVLTPSIKDRAHVDATTFLVMVYTIRAHDGHPTSLVPRFLECRYTKDDVNPEPLVTMLRKQQTCLAGLSSCTDDMEICFNTRLEVESTVAAEVPVNETNSSIDRTMDLAEPVHRRSESNVSDEEAKDCRSHHRAVVETNASVAQLLPVAVRQDTAEPVRDCCRSQQLLTLQHQQILENQQKQLHEMQAQIRQLQHLLALSKTKESVDGDDGNDPNASVRSMDEISRDLDDSFSDISSVASSVMERRFGTSNEVEEDQLSHNLSISSSQPTPQSLSRIESPAATTTTQTTDLMDDQDSDSEAEENMMANEISCSSMASVAEKLKVPVTGSYPYIRPEEESKSTHPSMLTNASIPRIQVKLHAQDDLSDTDDEEFKRIERKYAHLMLRSA